MLELHYAGTLQREVYVEVAVTSELEVKSEPSGLTIQGLNMNNDIEIDDLD